MSKVPIAIVSGKTDSANLCEEFFDEKIKELEFLNTKVEFHKSNAIDYLCRKFKKGNEMEAIFKTIADYFINFNSQYSYFIT